MVKLMAADAMRLEQSQAREVGATCAAAVQRPMCETGIWS
jgi:hypothetical protein